MFDRHPAVRPAGDDGIDLPLRKIRTDGVGIVALVSKQGIRRPLRQDDQGVIGLAVCRLAARQVEGERSPKSISQSVKLTGEPAPRAANNASMSPLLRKLPRRGRGRGCWRGWSGRCRP